MWKSLELVTEEQHSGAVLLPHSKKVLVWWWFVLPWCVILPGERCDGGSCLCVARRPGTVKMKMDGLMFHLPTTHLRWSSRSCFHDARIRPNPNEAGKQERTSEMAEGFLMLRCFIRCIDREVYYNTVTETQCSHLHIWQRRGSLSTSNQREPQNKSCQ